MCKYFQYTGQISLQPLTSSFLFVSNEKWYLLWLKSDLIEQGTIQTQTTLAKAKWRNNSYLKASMTYDEMGDAPGRPGCQDNDTLFLVTSVTWGFEGGPGSSFSSRSLTTTRLPDSEERTSGNSGRIRKNMWKNTLHKKQKVCKVAQKYLWLLRKHSKMFPH